MRQGDPRNRIAFGIEIPIAECFDSDTDSDPDFRGLTVLEGIQRISGGSDFDFVQHLLVIALFQFCDLLVPRQRFF